MKYLVPALSLAAPVFASSRLNFKPYFIEGYSHDIPRITSDKKYPGFPDYIEIIKLNTAKVEGGYFLGSWLRFYFTTPGDRAGSLSHRFLLNHA